MPRFRLSSAAIDTKKYGDTDESSSSSNSSSSISDSNGDGDDTVDNELVYSEDDDDDDDEEEPPHPIGFESWGRTRFGLNPVPEPTLQRYKLQKGYLYPHDDGLDDWNSPEDKPKQQQFPSILSYVDPQTVSTKSLLRHAAVWENSKRGAAAADDEMDKIAQLFQAAAMIDDRAARRILGSSQRQQQQQLVIKLPIEDMSSIQREMDLERRRMEREHVEAANALQKLLHQTQQAADRILAEQELFDQKQQQALDEEERRQEQDVAAKQQALQEQQKKVLEQETLEKEKTLQDQQQRDQVRQAKQDQEDVVTAAAAKEREYVAKAQKLVAQLVQVRASVEPFERSKAVGKRRLGMKKIINGKVNTLSENSGKIRSVAAEVSQAVAVARAEDEQLKQQLQAGTNQGLTPEMARGKRYLIDLLSSSVIKRVQAEGFNGPRGDGFPLANMLALVSIDSKDLIPVLTAHIYTVCPTAIPTLPTPSPDASEEELMQSLGMLKGKNGEFETFERFLARTEGVISIVANIMSSVPESHLLLGGHEGAINWLSRFLSLLPAAPESPLPLLTAPVLVAFLVGAGHMLANKHAEQFKILLDTIMNDIIKRLDDGAIGRPSATRLRKFVSGGFEAFKSTLPSRALGDLYLGAVGGGDGGQHGGTSSTAFGTSSGLTSQSPFGGGQQSGQQQSAAPRDPFGASSSATSGASPFGGAPTPSPFGGEAAPAPSPFGGPATSNQASGGAAPTPSLFGGGVSPAPAPFGDSMTADPSPSPFGGGAAPASSPFGGSSAPTQASFEMSMGPTPAPFGATNTPASFGAPVAPAASPFGGPASFGAPTSSPFGTQASTPTPSPFGGPPPTQQFGAAPSSSPFGSSAAPSQSPFGAGAAPSPSPFGSTPAPYGASAAPSPFGYTAAPSPSPFGSSTNNASGGYGQQTTPYEGGGGGGDQNQKKKPCKFFAQGQCRFGDKCRFSHDNPAQGGGGGGFGSNTNSYANSPFGGPRR